MSSPFVGLNVKLTLHSQLTKPLLAKILSIDPATNTLSLQAPDGERLSVSRNDIASLTAQAAEANPQVVPLRAEISTPSNASPDEHAKSSPRPTSAQAKAKVPVVLFVDPAILSYTNSAPSPKPSPRRAHATTAPVDQPAKTKKNKKAAKPQSKQDPLDDEFDFGASLANFDKKKIWDEIRSSDQTEPSTLLVSHNRVAGSPGALVRGLNGMGPANSVATPTRGRKDGQTKLRPDEMVLSPSPPSEAERLKGEDVIQLSTKPEQALTGYEANAKASYSELEDKIRKLQAELALARRRNVLLEELAGLGLGGAALAVQQPAIPSPSVGTPNNDPAIVSAVSSLSLGIEASKPARASTPASVPAIETAAAKPEPQFGHLIEAPIVTLMFPTAAAQHSALARMEAFYEAQGSAREYLTLGQAQEQRICRNYQGFNLPIVGQGVHGWLAAMYAASTTKIKQGARWWQSECSEAENEVLDLLVETGAMAADQGIPSSLAEGKLQYLISSTAAQCQSTLPHERLHALYFLSPSYRTIVHAQYSSLTPLNQKAIEHDLGMRNYAQSVWEDEFQAYLAEGHGTEREFGNKCANQCKEIAAVLRKAAQDEWRSIGGEGKEDEWEKVKWDVLDSVRTEKVAKKGKKGAKSR